MTTTDPTYTGRQLRELTVDSLTPSDHGAVLVDSSGTTCGVSHAVANALPSAASVEVETIGSLFIVGWRIDGRWVERRSDQDFERDQSSWQAEHRERQQATFNEYREVWQRRTEQLPDWMRVRLDGLLQAGGDEFAVRRWGYELLVAELGVLYADGDQSKIDAFIDQAGPSGHQVEVAAALARIHAEGGSLADTAPAL